ncbi:hypothetical protein [Enterococcus sp. 5H]|uniref:hypothetical protein n=1 Tax=Enterococcus sp. 5H TaxID=1229490 RepID=UPI002302E9EC|nr:hypothetical protein [Enterococcus sp. 5H]MDA9470614.1 hypothetical protein [Enterococcus sp. 5H]
MRTKLFISFCLCLVFIVGCKKTEFSEPLSVADKVLVWEKSQEKNFGKFDYLDITKEEAIKLMTEKFEVEMPKLYTEAIPIIEEALQTDENDQEAPVYTVKATGNTLSMRATYPYKNKADGKYYSYGTVELIYEFDEKKKLEWLSSQEITLVNYPETQKLYLNEPIKAIEKLSELAGVTELQQKVTAFNKKFNQSPEELEGQTLQIENSLKQAEKEHQVGRNLGMEFNENGTLNLVRVFIKNYTKT